MQADGVAFSNGFPSSWRLTYERLLTPLSSALVLVLVCMQLPVGGFVSVCNTVQVFFVPALMTTPIRTRVSEFAVDYPSTLEI